MTKAAVCACLMLLLSGCSTWSRETKIEFSAAEALSAVDVVQTRAAMRYCYTENNPLLGSHPSQSKTIGVGLIFSAAHWALTDYWERTDNRYMQRLTQWLFIVEKGLTVINNYGVTGQFLGANPCR